MKKLAIIDWGVGGISIYKLVKEELGLPVVYFSDTGATPYGKMTRDQLAGRLNQVLRFLKGHSVTHIVIGCNAASTALAYLDDGGLTIEGVIEPAVEMTIKLKPKRLGLIGGRRTVVSGVYRRAFAKRGIEVGQRIAQPLSGMIESGDIGSEELRDAARRMLRPIRNSTHILLACTHYPAITGLLQEMVSPETRFIDPAGELVVKIAEWRLEHGDSDEFFTTGEVRQMKSAAKKAFGVVIENASRVRP